MKKEQFLLLKKDLQSKVGVMSIETEREAFSDFVIGCFYDEKEQKWKVYVNGERGRHDIWLVTDSEEEAFDEFMSIINYEIENAKCEQEYNRK